MPLDCEQPGRVIQFLADILADALQGAAAAFCGAGSGVGFVVLVHAGQLWRQRCAFGLQTGCGVGSWRRRQRLQLQLDGRDVGFNGLIEQAGLGRVKLLAAFAKLPALQYRHLVCELVDLGLAVFDLAVFARNGLVALDYLPIMLANPDHQSRDHITQFRSAQTCQ